jgi:hypothetical protein
MVKNEQEWYKYLSLLCANTIGPCDAVTLIGIISDIN